ncbi:hypothetical protein DAEQUDRAFT_71068 [Daedalea quercina L-15889]|uniref:Uncharacterized protein n=1 Tax=Daedalea quercina L-15889 TaxID=1314783 RepID=A0A165L527_9APHY|nr:hypothetical protein DAEQUDRAFT_71068 [Daedalea quercina L-15889]
MAVSASWRLCKLELTMPWRCGGRLGLAMAARGGLSLVAAQQAQQQLWLPCCCWAMGAPSGVRIVAARRAVAHRAVAMRRPPGSRPGRAGRSPRRWSQAVWTRGDWGRDKGRWGRWARGERGEQGTHLMRRPACRVCPFPLSLPRLSPSTGPTAAQRSCSTAAGHR